MDHLSGIDRTLRILGMSWGLKTTCFEAPGVSLGGSGVSIGGFRILREVLVVPVTDHDGSMGRRYIYLHGWLFFMVFI